MVSRALVHRTLRVRTLQSPLGASCGVVERIRGVRFRKWFRHERPKPFPVVM